MRILLIQVGNYVDAVNRRSDLRYYLAATLLYGEQYFDEPQIINNIQTRESVINLGCDVLYVYHTHRKNFRDLVLSSIKIRSIEKEFSPDLTHVYWGGVSGLFAAMAVKGKCIVSLFGSDVYGSYSEDGRRRLTSLIQAISSKLIPLFSDRVIVMSERMKKQIWSLLRKNVEVIPEGVSLSKFFPINIVEARRRLDWALDRFIIIFFYQGQGVKNFQLAQSVYEFLQNRIDKIEMVIVSGFNHDQLNDVYNGADCLLVTSLHEGSNNSIKEALACNLPVVTVACGDAEERLANVANSYVCGYDVAELSDAVLSVYTSGSRSDGRKFAADVELEVCAKRLVDVYRGVITQ